MSGRRGRPRLSGCRSDSRPASASSRPRPSSCTADSHRCHPARSKLPVITRERRRSPRRESAWPFAFQPETISRWLGRSDLLVAIRSPFRSHSSIDNAVAAQGVWPKIFRPLPTVWSRSSHLTHPPRGPRTADRDPHTDAGSGRPDRRVPGHRLPAQSGRMGKVPHTSPCPARQTRGRGPGGDAAATSPDAASAPPRRTRRCVH